jgi:hypothetical protein
MRHLAVLSLALASAASLVSGQRPSASAPVDRDVTRDETARMRDAR